MGSDEAHEAMRDLVRLRSHAMRDLRKSRRQLLSLLLPRPQFAVPAEMLQRIERAEALCGWLKAAIL